MRNTIISAICVTAVFLYSIFTMLYVNDFSERIKKELPPSFEISDINTDKINDIYNEKKKILGIILNRDQLEEIEDIIINLESAVKFDNSQEIYNNICSLKSAIDYISKLNSFTI